MQDISQDLIKQIRELAGKHLKSNSEYKKCWSAIKNGSTDVTDAMNYADVIGEALGEAVKAVLSENVLPDGTLHYNILQKIVDDVYSEAYDMCAEAQKMVLESCYKKAGYSIKAQNADKETKKKRLNEIVNKVSGGKYEEIKNELYQVTRSLPQAGASDTIYETGSFASEAGLYAKVRRTAAAGCCEECARRAGEEEYPGVDKIIFYRHANCRCKVEYFPGDGTKQNAHTKEWTTIAETDKIVKRKNVGLKTITVSDKQFGEKAGKHASDFGLDPSDEKDRDTIRSVIQDIIDEPDEIREGEWRGKIGLSSYYIKDNDVVVVNSNEFVTILKDGITNARIKNARKRKI